MKKIFKSNSIAVSIITAVFATSGLAAPPKESPPDDWEVLLSNVEVIVENTDTIEIDISGLQTSVDGVQASVDSGVTSLTADVVGVKADVADVKAGVAGVQASVDSGVTSLTAGVVGVKADVADVKADVAGVQASVDGGVTSLTTDVAGVQGSVNGVQDSVDNLAVSLDALESVISELVGSSSLTEHLNGAETLYSTAGANTFDYWTYGDYADPRHVSLTLQARGMDSSDVVEVWVRTHPSDSTFSDKNVRQAYQDSDFSMPSEVEQIEFDAIEWGVRIAKNDANQGSNTQAINLTWAATVSALDYQNGAQTVTGATGSNVSNRWVNGDYASPRHVSLTLQARGMDSSDVVEVWVRTHPSDSTFSDKNVRQAYQDSDFSMPSEVEQIEFDAIEWGIAVHKNDANQGSNTAAIDLTWAATTE